jgi:ligand-binding sensor domain-containing protein/serine phosphatase RsbU (regulator of sigma subunit)
MRKTFFLILIISSLSVSTMGQSFQIMHYGIKDGLCHGSTSSIIQDAGGYIWIATTQGLCRMDGKTFSSEFSGDALPSSLVSATFRDSRDRLWFGYVDGEIAMLKNGQFTVFQQGDAKRSSIAGFAEDDKGNILAMTQQHGLITIDKNFEFSYLSDPFNSFFVSGFILTSEGNLLVGGFDGLTLFISVEGEERYEKSGRLSDIPFTRVHDIEMGLVPGSYWVGTEDEGFYSVRGSGSDPESYTVVNEGNEHGLEYSSIISIMADEAGYLWLSDYGKGVYRFRINADGRLDNPLLFTVEGGLQEEYIRDMLIDDEGNVWFVSQSNGVSILRDQAFTFYDLLEGVEVPAISAISIKGADHWFGTRDGNVFFTDNQSVTPGLLFTPSDGLPGDAITALWNDEKGDLFIGTFGSGIFCLERSTMRITRFFNADNSLGNTINAIDGDEDFIYIATNNGIYVMNRITRGIEHQTTMTGLPHNVINDVLIDREGMVWIATRGSGIYCVASNDQCRDIVLQGSPKLEFVSLAEDEKGRIWGGTTEDGVFFFGKDSLEFYSLQEGLRSKYTYAIDIDPLGYVWVGHRLGLSRINPETGNIVVYNQEMGFTSDILHRAIDVNDNGIMLFGTNNGLIAYDAYRSYKDTIPPRLNIVELNISDSIYDTSEDIQLPYGNYKVRIDFIGINLSNPDQVTYRYKLDGYDDWSEPTRETFARYSRIEDGDYTFMLSACDGSGNCTGEVAMFNLSVKIPIWKAWWFIVSLVILAIAGIYFYIKIRERNQKALQEYLEQQLEERTREVISQKEEIEIKNRDITDSINYAQRIQASILPSVQMLRSTFGGSFVFYQPRDIVSGDFYWYDRIGDERFIIVCADSTGHGVPGAFMSMIGTTLIKDICQRPQVKTPSDVLQTLDEEVRTALHQNNEGDGSNDGMDIIVAEINLKTNRFMVSSAMRPVIIYKGGEQIYVKGSRSSIGGQLDDTSVDKEFINEEFQLTKGDIVYMFSDGYPDQFGGPLGRKFKMVRLKNLLRDIHDKPMEEQYNYVKSNFFLWKEDLEQVDDVLFMGIRI